jgi:hypothetical protein
MMASRYYMICQPEMLLSKVNVVDVVFRCLALFVSQHSRKPHVRRN